jgi:hypothetical protein
VLFLLIGGNRLPSYLGSHGRTRHLTVRGVWPSQG